METKSPSDTIVDTADTQPSDVMAIADDDTDFLIEVVFD